MSLHFYAFIEILKIWLMASFGDGIMKDRPLFSRRLILESEESEIELGFRVLGSRSTILRSCSEIMVRWILVILAF